MSVRLEESTVPRTGAVLRGIPRGIAQVYLQDSVVTGALFLVALLVAGPVVGLVPATFPFVLAMWTADLWRARYGADQS